MGESSIEGAGIGLFNITHIKRNELVACYFGEIIPGEETDIRDDIAEIDK